MALDEFFKTLLAPPEQYNSLLQFGPKNIGEMTSETLEPLVNTIFQNKYGRTPTFEELQTITEAVRPAIASNPSGQGGVAGTGQERITAINNAINTAIEKFDKQIQTGTNLLDTVISPSPNQPTATQPTIADIPTNPSNSTSPPSADPSLFSFLPPDLAANYTKQIDYYKQLVATTTDPALQNSYIQTILNIQDNMTREAKYYQDKQETADKEKTLQDEADAEAALNKKVEEYLAEIGGGTASDEIKIRKAIEGLGEGADEASVLGTTLQDILSGRARAYESDIAGFDALRDTLSGDYAKSRGELETTALGAIGDYETTTGEAIGQYADSLNDVQRQVLEDILPQIQSQLAARGLETGGGAFQAQTAKLGTQLAATTAADVASKRLGLTSDVAAQKSNVSQTVGGLARTDQEMLSQLQAAQSEVMRIKKENDIAQREGRLDQSMVNRLNAAMANYNQVYSTLTGRTNNLIGAQQNLSYLQNQQGFSGAQAAFDRASAQKALDLQARQFENDLAYRYSVLNFQKGQANKRPSLGQQIGGVLGTVAGPFLGQTGYNLANRIFSPQQTYQPPTYASNPNLNMRSTYQSPLYSTFSGRS